MTSSTLVCCIVLRGDFLNVVYVVVIVSEEIVYSNIIKSLRAITRSYMTTAGIILTLQGVL